MEKNEITLTVGNLHIWQVKSPIGKHTSVMRIEGENCTDLSHSDPDYHKGIIALYNYKIANNIY